MTNWYHAIAFCNQLSIDEGLTPVYTVNGSTVPDVWDGTTGGTTGHANELGLYDMSGNVWEWNWDRYSLYPVGTLTDYRGAALGGYRERRGGSWRRSASLCTVAYRYCDSPNYQSISVGFRVVRP